MEYKSMSEILADLKKYNDTHSRSLTYGKYVQMLEQEDEKKAEQVKKRKKVRTRNDQPRKKEDTKKLCTNRKKG